MKNGSKTTLLSSKIFRTMCVYGLRNAFEMIRKCWSKSVSGNHFYCIIFIDIVHLYTFVFRFGGTEGATFCALTTLCKELETFNAIDVYQVAKLYHNKRPGIWKSPVIKTQLLLWGRPVKKIRIFWIYLLYFGNQRQMADIENLMVLPSFILHKKACSHALQMSCS